MRKVEFDPAGLTGDDQKWWKAWQKKSDEARSAAIDAWEQWLAGDRKQPFKCSFKQSVWRGLKAWMRENIFNEKCAYCETHFTRTVGDAEHYRPKAGVAVRKEPREYAQCEIPLPPESPHGALPHPGYFWLAYHWENLVPACEFCNSNEGKLEQYPVAAKHVFLKQLTPEQKDLLKGPSWESRKWPGWYYLSPRDLDDLERPLIINPLNASPEYNPCKHLRFGVAGMICPVANSDIGKRSIEVYNLDTEKLRQMRQKAQELAKFRYLEGLGRANDDEDPKAVAQNHVQSFSEHKEPYSSAALAYLERYTT